MTDSSLWGSVSIDTNVFLYLLNPKYNTAGHISELLAHQGLRTACLLVDRDDRIFGEYRHHLERRIIDLDDTGNEIHILRYWILEAPRCVVELDMTDRLMRSIRNVVFEASESVDRIFVYVALKTGSLLITNDDRHILVGSHRERNRPPRRKSLLRNTRKVRPAGAEILTSQETHAMISQP